MNTTNKKNQTKSNHFIVATNDEAFVNAAVVSTHQCADFEDLSSSSNTDAIEMNLCAYELVKQNEMKRPADTQENLFIQMKYG